MFKWWGIWLAYRCFIDGGSDDLKWHALSGCWLSCTGCWLYLLSMKWLLCGTLSLHISTSLGPGMVMSRDYCLCTYPRPWDLGWLCPGTIVSAHIHVPVPGTWDGYVHGLLSLHISTSLGPGMVMSTDYCLCTYPRPWDLGWLCPRTIVSAHIHVPGTWDGYVHGLLSLHISTSLGPGMVMSTDYLYEK